MNFLENITFRRTRTTVEPNDSDNDEYISQTLECTTNTPEISEDEDDKELNILRKEVKILKFQLENAHRQIDLLTSEICTLKQANTLTKNNEFSQKVPINPPTKTQTPPNLNKAKKRRSSVNKKATVEVDDCLTTTEARTGHSLSGTTSGTATETNPPPPILKHNICILSGETSNRLYKISQRTDLSNFNLCHYRMPKCGLKHILINIDKKVENFTHNDYCVIYIGEEDFRTTYNYIELVTFIRSKLQNLTHTNFIICLPTFKYTMEDKNIMFNNRVDMFNNLIYIDVETHKYAYILDSNLNLPYTYDSYNQRYGSLNNKGLSIILFDLQNLILYLNSTIVLTEVDEAPTNDASVNTKLDSQFFLL